MRRTDQQHWFVSGPPRAGRPIRPLRPPRTRRHSSRPGAARSTNIRIQCSDDACLLHTPCRHSSLSRAGRSTDIRKECSAVYTLRCILWLGSRAEIINVSYHMDSAIAPDRHSAGWPVTVSFKISRSTGTPSGQPGRPRGRVPVTGNWQPEWKVGVTLGLSRQSLATAKLSD